MSASMAEIREILKDLAVSQKKTDEQIEEVALLQKENHEEIAQSQKKTDKIVKEVALLQKENHEEMAQSQKKTDKIVKEVALLQKENHEEIAQSQKKTDKIVKEVALLQKENHEEMAQSQKRTDEQIRKNHEEITQSQKKTKKIIEEVAQSQKETNEQIKKTQASLKKLSKLFGNTQKNQGPIVEEFFYNSLKENMVVGGVEYYSIAKNVRPPVNPRNEEYDIVMVNREQILLIEVKLKAHPNDIEKLLEQMSHYQEHFPQYKGFKLIGALATFSADAIFGSDALLPGMMLLQRSGKVIKTIVK